MLNNTMHTTICVLLLVWLSACTTFTPSQLDYSSVELPGQNKPSMDYSVYTPPDWTRQESLPLILFLHGMGDSHLSFEKNGAAAYFDQQINAGNMPRVILLSPNGGRGFWENWHDGSANYRDWVMQGVVPKVQQAYNTRACPEHCHLMGISMGGFGALRFAYYHQNEFSSLSVISGAIFNREQHLKTRKSFWLNLLVPFDRIFGEGFKEDYYRSSPFYAFVQEPGLAKMRLQLMLGDQDTDNIKIGNSSFHKKLDEHQIKHDYVIFEGGHNWRSWLPNLADSINFLTEK